MDSTSPSRDVPDDNQWLPPSIEELGSLLPDYQITEVLGIGGMAAVYRGTEKIMGRDVAIKILSLTALGSDHLNYADRFKQEAVAMGNLSHPGIVKVFGFGEAGDAGEGNEILWFAMEYVDGRNLHEFLHERGGKVPVGEALSITCHILDALSEAHSENIIHRDIKPGNVMLDKDGTVKILDFGLAQVVDENGEGAESGVTLGTPGYVAPESLVIGHPVDGRADLFATGAMLYELLTGAVPVDYYEVPSEAVPGLDSRLDEVIEKALQANPEARFADAASFRNELDEILKQQGEVNGSVSDGIAPVSPLRNRHTALGEKKNKFKLAPIAAIAAVVLAGWGLFQIFQSDRDDEAFLVAEAPDVVIPKSPGNDGKPNQQGTLNDQTGSDAGGDHAVPAVDWSEPNSPDNPPAAEPAATFFGISTEPDSPTPEAPEAKPEESPPGGMPAEPSSPPPHPGPNPDLVGEVVIPPILDERVQRFEEVKLNRALVPFRQEVSPLARNYLNAIQRSIASAKTAGNTGLVSSLEEEMRKVEELAGMIDSVPPDEVPALPELPAAAYAVQVKLRETWQTNLAKFRDQYDLTVNDVTEQFASSLQRYETELASAQRAEDARLVSVYRMSLMDGPKGNAPSVMAGSGGGRVLAGQFEPVPQSDPFPLPPPRRPDEPCRVVAWRLDGKPIDPRNFANLFFCLPDSLGVVVDLDMGQWSARSRPVKMVALTPEGKIRVSDEKSRPFVEEIEGAVSMAGLRELGIALFEDGTCQPFSLLGRPLRDNDWRGDLKKMTSWENVVAVDAGERHVMALTADGTPLAAGGSNGGANTHQVPSGLDSRTCRIMAGGTSAHYFAISRDGSRIERVNANSGQVGRRFPRESRFFGLAPRITDWNGENLDMLSNGGNADSLVGAPPSDVTYAYGMGWRYRDKNVTVACLREGIDDWRFWGDLGEYALIDPTYCMERAHRCRRVFINPPYVIGLKPVSAITPADWTGEGAELTSAKPVQALPRYQNAFPLKPPTRPVQGGRVQVYRRDGSDLDPKSIDIATMPDDLGNRVVDLRVSANYYNVSGIVLLDDGTVRGWNKKIPEVDLSMAREVVSIRSGFDSLMMLDRYGDAIYWTRNGGIEKGRFNDRNEPVCRIALAGNQPFVLTESGSVHPVRKMFDDWMVSELPPTIELIAGNYPYAYGVDGHWRSWNNQSNRRIAALVPSRGVVQGMPAGNDLWWLDEGMNLNRTNQYGLEGDIGRFRDQKARQLSGGAHGMVFVRTRTGQWEIHTGANKQREYLEPLIQGSLTIGVTGRHVLCVKP